MGLGKVREPGLELGTHKALPTRPLAPTLLVTFDQFNASLLNKNINFLQQQQNLTGPF